MGARNKTPRKPRPRKPSRPATVQVEPAPEEPVGGDPLAAIARAQEGQLSAEGFWKAGGRFTKLR